MRVQPSSLKRLTTLFLLGFCSLLMLTAASAQDNAPAPQFLYRSDNHLVLVNGYTGESTKLPFDVTDRDYFRWSPDGKVLLAKLYDSENYNYCLNLYDVDKQKWAYSKPISCTVHEAIFSDDSSRIYYSTDNKINGKLWIYDLKKEKSQVVYQTTGSDELNPDGISQLKWSPTKTYLTFESYHQIMGGTLNSFVVLNVENGKYMTLNAPDIYYASYYPVWSADDRWFLAILQEQYVTNAVMAVTNHQGDLYLVNSETGKQFRLTYTPAAYETEVHWTEDGKIAFTEVIEQKQIFTLEQAMNIKIVSSDQIVTPEPIDVDAFSDSMMNNIMISPEADLGAWITQSQQADNKSDYQLSFGYPPNIEFSIPISDPYQTDTVLIGWRPSSYPYSSG